MYTLNPCTASKDKLYIKSLGRMRNVTGKREGSRSRGSESSHSSSQLVACRAVARPHMMDALDA